jgi:hypothetical protein
MNYQEKFLHILTWEHESELVPLFRSMDEDAKREFVPYLKTIFKEYLEYKEKKSLLGGITVERRASETQASLIMMAAFICFSEKDFEKAAINLWSLTPQRLDSILPWYCPKWFNEYLNGLAAEEFLPHLFKYDWVMKSSQYGIVTPSRELIAKLLPGALFETNRDNKTWTRPENLLKHPATLAEHVWFLFEAESTIYLANSYMHFADDSNKEESQWLRWLTIFSREGKIDRARLLRESILATTRNFNKLLTGWFAELFIMLDPDVHELLAIQPEILNAINAKHSKAINVALNAVKKIVDENDFQASAFLENVPLLLASETKSILSSTLVVLDKLAKKQVSLRDEICVLACQAFLHAEGDIQTKASKLIQKYGQPQVELLQQTLLPYKQALLMDAKENLAAFLATDSEAPREEPSPAGALVAEERVAIAEIDTIDELIFLASQAFDNNSSHHIDLLPAALIRLDHGVRGDVIGKLEPALKSALRTVMVGGSATAGYLDHLLAAFFINYALLLIDRHPADAKSLADLYNPFLKDDQANKARYRGYLYQLPALKDWRPTGSSPIYTPHKMLLLLALKKIETNDTLPLLSTPTNEPAFISPEVLIDRLKRYEESGQAVDPFDFQVAVSRCDLSAAEECLPLLERTLDGEIRNILRFLFTPGLSPQEPFNLPAVWMACSVAKKEKLIYNAFENFRGIAVSQKYFTGQFPWRSNVETYTFNEYNHKAQKTVVREGQRKKLEIDFEKRRVENKPKTLVAGLISKFVGGQQREEVPASPTLYDCIDFRAHYMMFEFHDIARLIYLMPNNPEPVLVEVMAIALQYPNFWESGHQHLVTRAIEALVPLHVAYGETGHLFIATCMLCADKTIQSFAAEVWSRGVATQHVDAVWVGDILGKHESIEFAPLKRFTDLVASNLMNLSPYHNQQLERLMVRLLLGLHGEPITNLRKLLEQYYELVSANQSTVPDNLLQHMKPWSSSGSLKKILSSIMKYQGS